MFGLHLIRIIRYLFANLYWIIPTVFSVILTAFLIIIARRQNAIQRQNVEIVEEQKNLQQKGLDIASNQITIQNQNVRLSLYDKRIDFYYELKKRIHLFIGAGYEKNWEMFHEMSDLHMESKFLFEEDLSEYIGEIAEKMRVYLLIEIDTSILVEIDATELGHPIRDREDITEEQNRIMGEINLWFNYEEENQALYNKFKRYLDVKDFGLTEQ